MKCRSVTRESVKLNQNRSGKSRHLHLIPQHRILPARLEIPRLPEKLVSRPRLLAELDRGPIP